MILNERLSKEEIDKIDKGKNQNMDILTDALTEVNGVNLLLHKKRKIQYEKESLIKSDNLNESFDNESNNNIDSKQNNDTEKKEIINDNKNKKFCLYCDLFKIFDNEEF